MTGFEFDNVEEWESVPRHPGSDDGMPVNPREIGAETYLWQKDGVAMAKIDTDTDRANGEWIKTDTIEHRSDWL